MIPVLKVNAITRHKLVLFAIRIVQNKLCSGFAVRTHKLRKVQQVKLSKTPTDLNVPNARWESFEWRPRELHFVVIGDTGHVSGFATFRGKPRDAGFRQRFMGFTQTWVRQEGAWKLLCWHQSPLLGRIAGASPS